MTVERDCARMSVRLFLPVCLCGGEAVCRFGGVPVGGVSVSLRGGVKGKQAGKHGLAFPLSVGDILTHVDDKRLPKHTSPQLAESMLGIWRLLFSFGDVGSMVMTWLHSEYLFAILA